MSKEDVKNILDNYDCSFDDDHLLQYTYDEWVKEKNVNDIIFDTDFRTAMNKSYLKYKELMEDNEKITAQQYLDIFTDGYREAFKRYNK